jgi:putative transposase
MRLGFLRKTSTAIIETQAVVCVEDPDPEHVPLCPGARESPGRMVRQKTGLNRSILSRGVGIFFALLEYELSRNG